MDLYKRKDVEEIYNFDNGVILFKDIPIFQNNVQLLDYNFDSTTFYYYNPNIALVFFILGE